MENQIILTEKQKIKIKENHITEDKYNEELGDIDKLIESLNKRKLILASKISKLVRYRNILINKVYSGNKNIKP